MIRTGIIFLVTIFSCQSQNTEDDALILEQVIEITHNLREVTYHLRENINTSKNNLKRYYDYRYLNEPFYKIVKEYDIENNTIIYEESKSNERKKNWDSKIKIIDSIFSKKDIEKILKDNETAIKWKDKEIETINENLNVEFALIGGNYISRPYYRSDNEFAIVLHYFKGNNTMFIFHNSKKSNWELFSRIDDLWW